VTNLASIDKLKALSHRKPGTFKPPELPRKQSDLSTILQISKAIPAQLSYPSPEGLCQNMKGLPVGKVLQITS
jgi:hypothetical protein